MIKAAKAANSFTPMFATSLDDDGGATAKTTTCTFSGTATAAGTIYGYVHGVRVTAAVASGDAATVVSAAWDAALTATTKELQMSNAEATGVVTLTARNAGAEGEYFDVRFNYYDGEEFPAGITCAVAAGTSGATNPDITTAIAAIGDIQYHTIISGYTDATNLTALETELTARWAALAENDGHAFQGVTGNLSAHTTLGSARNSAYSTIMGGGLSPTTPWEWASVAGAIDAFEPDPARPRQTLRLPGLLAPAREVQFTRTERETLLNNGIATHVADNAGNVYVERMITTFQTDALSNASTVFLDITTPRTLSRLRFDWRTRISAKYPRHKLADDGTLFAPGQPVVTPNVIRAEAHDLFLNAWEPQGLVEGYDQFADDLIVERNAGDVNRLDCQLCPDLMNQLRITATQISFLL
jgi:phage tail sheath gpL-like